MKFGIMTFHNIPNVGAILQAYSLCKVIRMMGQECYLVDYTCDNIRKRELIMKKGRYRLGNLIRAFFFYLYEKKKIDSCQEFMTNEQMYSKKYASCNKELADDFDVFISGSDMIWNLDFTAHDWSYYLDFLPDDKLRYSYASSIGEKWQKDDVKRVRTLLSKYRMLSTRETDTSEYLTNLLGKQCDCVPDPTILLQPEYWRNMAPTTEESNYVLIYFPCKEILQVAQEYAKRNRLRVIVINNGLPIMKSNIVNKAIYDPLDWLALINGATAVFTNSYHGFLFSLYFNKPVWTNKPGNRFVSLLEKFELKNCYIYQDKDLKNKIDYQLVNSKLEKMREFGLEYVYRIIGDANENYQLIRGLL